MTRSDGLLRLEGVTRRFGGLVAVDNVSLNLAQGELAGLIGPNGAGKTTLFNCITGFTPPTEGLIYFKDDPIGGLKPSAVARKGIGRTFQNLRVMPNMTVFDNVSIGAIGLLGHSLSRTIFGFGRDPVDDRISEITWAILQKANLTEQADQLAANLSYGKRKYLEIARALASDPTLLILDEPAAGLNEQETGQLAEFIAKLHEDGLTILLVEHDMTLVMNICKRVIVLALGKKIADGTPAVIRKDQLVLEAYLGGEECQF